MFQNLFFNMFYDLLTKNRMVFMKHFTHKCIASHKTHRQSNENSCHQNHSQHEVFRNWFFGMLYDSLFTENPMTFIEHFTSLYTQIKTPCNAGGAEKLHFAYKKHRFSVKKQGFMSKTLHGKISIHLAYPFCHPSVRPSAKFSRTLIEIPSWSALT